MNRREFLHRSGALTTVVGLAGCLGSSVSGDRPESQPSDETTSPPGTTPDSSDTTTRPPETTDDGTTDDGTTNDETTDGESGDGFSGLQSDRDAPFRTFRVGTRDGVPFPDDNLPREVRVWNDADASREITLRVASETEVRLDRTVEFAPDAYLTVVLNEPDDYRVAVGLAGTDLTTFEVERSSFDCNATRTDVGVLADESVETLTFSTALACPGPKVASTDFSVGDGECGTDHRATVAYAGERVRVEGAVRTSTPRANLALAGVSYDQQAGALTVRVRASESDDDSGMGTQCVGEVPYEVSVGFDYALPPTVVVVHETPRGTVEVTRATLGE